MIQEYRNVKEWVSGDSQRCQFRQSYFWKERRKREESTKRSQIRREITYTITMGYYGVLWGGGDKNWQDRNLLNMLPLNTHNTNTTKTLLTRLSLELDECPLFLWTTSKESYD